VEGFLERRHKPYQAVRSLADSAIEEQMISEGKLPELITFKKVERRLPFTFGPSSGICVPSSDNSSLPVHRWFRFKESFSGDLLKNVVEVYARELGKTFRFLDPFCGVGTSLVTAQELSACGFHVNAIGIERNPFIAFVARTKVSWPEINPDRISELGASLLTNSSDGRVSLPRLSSVKDGRCISQYLARRIVAIRNSIRRDGYTPTHDALLLGLGATVEPVSRVRKDGRALRLVDRARPHFERTLRDKWQLISADVHFFQNTLQGTPIPLVIVGDGRVPSKYAIKPGSVDLIVTSPPYPNNIDYSEVYKLELWLLGFIEDAHSFLQLRYSTFRSHPTCSTPDPPIAFLAELKRGALRGLLAPLLQRVDQMPRCWRRRLLIGYFSDMWRSLGEFYECLRPGGLAIIVVGNSLHNGTRSPYVIPTDLALATIGKCVGFEVESVAVVRSLKRRLSGNHYLRESIIVLRKADGSRD